MLSDARSALQAVNVEVLLVSFVGENHAIRWQTEVVGLAEDVFMMAHDELRHVYHAYGLHRDAKAFWGLNAIKYYAKEAVKGHLPSIHGDPNQLGGEYLVGHREKRLLLCHPSRDPTDRPTLAEIVQVASIHEGVTMESVCDAETAMSLV